MEAGAKKICSRPCKAFELLPNDLIIEILTWLPAKCLKRYVIVCKLWCMIIKSRKFIEKHMQHAEPKKYLLSLSEFPSDPNPRLFLYTIDGLILDQSENNSPYRIRNLATNWTLLLPKHEFKIGRSIKLHMSYLPSIDKYKLLSVHFTRDYAHFDLKVLTLGLDLTWRPVQVPISFCRNKQDVLRLLTFSGINFFMRYCCIKCCCRIQIIALQAEDDSFAEIHVPQRVDILLRTKEATFRLIEWDKKLSIWCMLEGELHIWVLQDFKKAEWDERKIVIPSSVIKQYPFIKNDYYPYKIEGTMLVMTGPRNLPDLYYDLKSKQILEKSEFYVIVATSIVNLTSYDKGS